MKSSCTCRRCAGADVWVLSALGVASNLVADPGAALRCARCGGAINAERLIVSESSKAARPIFQIPADLAESCGALRGLAAEPLDGRWYPISLRSCVNATESLEAGFAELVVFAADAAELGRWDELATAFPGNAFYAHWVALSGSRADGVWGTLPDEDEGANGLGDPAQACKIFGIWCSARRVVNAPVPPKARLEDALTNLCRAVAPRGNFAVSSAHPVAEGAFEVEVEIGRQMPVAWLGAETDERAFRVHLYGDGVDVEPQGMVMARVPSSRRSTRLLFTVRSRGRKAGSSLRVDVMGSLADYYTVSLALGA